MAQSPRPTVDPEFESLIPPLSPEESVNLVDSLKKYGCRHPLDVWNGILVDGHNRLRICERYSIPYETLPIDLGPHKSEEEGRLLAKDYILFNQSARRNLTDFQRAEMALHRKDVLHRLGMMRRGENLRQGSANPPKLPDVPALEHRGATGRTIDKIARDAGLSKGTIHNVATIKERGTQALQQATASGAASIDTAAKLAKHCIPAVQDAFAAGEITKAQFNDLLKISPMRQGDALDRVRKLRADADLGDMVDVDLSHEFRRLTRAIDAVHQVSSELGLFGDEGVNKRSVRAVWVAVRKGLEGHEDWLDGVLLPICALTSELADAAEADA